MVEEGIRLACPGCDLAYKLKRLRPGKMYHCKQCGTVLRLADGSPLPSAVVNPGTPSPPVRDGDRTGEWHRISSLLETLAARLEARTEGGEGEAGLSPAHAALAAVEERIATLNILLEARFASLDAAVNAGAPAQEAQDALEAAARRLEAVEEGLRERLGAVEERLAVLGDTVPGHEVVDALREEAKKGAQALREGLERLGESAESTRRELAAFLAAEAGRKRPEGTVEVNIDELSDRLVAGIRKQAPLSDEDSGGVVDAVARLADQLVGEQDHYGKRLDSLASEIRQATAHISRLDEWRGELPARVADEIGATVEERVVGPIATALSRQAPAILSGLQDSKLVDIVSRSVREAQRPLLREILSGGRGGLPWWSFFSLLVPLLLILGYLYLPGDDASIGERFTGAREEIAAGQDEIIGLLLDAADREGAAAGRLAALEEAVRNIGEGAVGHARDNARLAEETKALRTGIESLERAIEEYKALVVRQDARLRQYERRLIQLGVQPETVGD